MTRYIFVTGGVVSGLGKGITAASLGLLLKSSGLKVDAIKFDPYLNVDPGTMSPFEHGEVYILADGSETDLDLGHYERFLETNLISNSSVTAGKIYSSILQRERNGDYLGKNVQLIPHVTNYIKECFIRGCDSDVRIIEIGGSTGDFEGEVFLESFRQFKREHSDNVLHVHLGYVPFLKCSGEYKSKPLQTSVRELLRTGLQPDVIVARYSIEDGLDVGEDLLSKIALFSNLPPSRIIKLPDADNIYQVPLYLKKSKTIDILETFLTTKLVMNVPSFYENYQRVYNNGNTISIAIVAKYSKLSDSYLSIIESLKIAGVGQGVHVKSVFVDAEEIEKNGVDILKDVDGILVPGGFGVRGMEGKIMAIEYARVQKIPFLGICLGLQMSVVEFARNVCGLQNAVSSEMFDDRVDLADKEVVIDYLPEQLNIHKKGGTMRLGDYSCIIEENSLAMSLFDEKSITERHRHRLEVQQAYVPTLEKHGMVISGKHYLDSSTSNLSYLVEMIELDTKEHPFFIATQSHPEMLSRPTKPHPLFSGLIYSAVSGKL